MVYILHDKIHNTAAAVCIITEQINYVDFLIFLYRGLFGSGSSNSLATYNSPGHFFELVPLQLPRTGARAIELATRIALKLLDVWVVICCPSLLLFPKEMFK